MTVRGQCQKASRVILGMVPTILVAGVAMGTGVLVAQQPPGQSQVTFARDIAPILQRSCQNPERASAVAKSPARKRPNRSRVSTGVINGARKSQPAWPGNASSSRAESSPSSAGARSG